MIFVKFLPKFISFLPVMEYNGNDKNDNVMEGSIC